MENKKTLYVALALVGGIIVGYMTGGANISVQDQGATARISSASDAVAVSNSEKEKNILSNLKREQRIAQAGCTPASRKYIKVLSPNGGEIYTAGEQIAITWTSCNIGNTVAIGMEGLGSANMTGAFPNIQILTVPNTGFAQYTLPNSSLFYSPNGLIYNQPVYKIVVYIPGGIQDSSNDWFTLVPTFPPGCLSYFGFSPTTGMPCWITTTPPTSVTSTSAVLNGYLFNNFPATIQANINPSVGAMTGYIQSSAGPSSVNVSGLTPNTTYQFMMCTLNAPTYPGLGCGGPMISFTTLP